MMKQTGMALAGMLFAFSVSAMALTEGKQYQTLKKPVADAAPVVEFFSFYCPHCYDFEKKMGVPAAIQKLLPPDTQYVKYHVSFMGPLAGDLTHAWAVASALGVEDKVEDALFDGLQKKQTIKTTSDIRKVFVEAAGITAEEYDAAWNSFIVKSLAIKQEKAAENFQLEGVPSVYVHGKYVVNVAGMDNGSIDGFVRQYAETVKYLVDKK